ncbi:hypothetical protein AB205_0138840 [Aquarana catesbeiana]|uniref:Uncharacterized protein n=1 Tax=Aquarana catesbeiana TaxID=8400 RepID=A0A2G9S239_AQUCT|nr:hypothetical protein AB205_0138840 [Aquarana catesbeiana]
MWSRAHTSIIHMSAPEERFEAAKRVKLFDVVNKLHIHYYMKVLIFLPYKDIRTIDCAVVILTFIQLTNTAGPLHFTINVHDCKHVITSFCRCRLWRLATGASSCMCNSMYVKHVLMQY